MTVFIGHIHEEATVAQCLKNGIMAAFPHLGEEVYVSSDPEHLGDDWIKRWGAALKDAKVVVLLCSPTAARRPWICVELGAGWLKREQGTCRLLVVCHSGQQKDRLPVLPQIQALQSDENTFAQSLFHAVGVGLGMSPDHARDAAFMDQFRATVQNLKKSRDLPVQPKVEAQYLPVTISRRGDTLRVESAGEARQVSSRLPFADWCDQVDRLQRFLADPDERQVADVGLAIGIQNALWANGKLYPGLRMKGQIDKFASGATVAQGAFNTGYQLLKRPTDMACLASVADLQDLFVLVGKHHRKRAITEVDPVYESFKRQVGDKRFKLQLGDGGEELVTVCLNKSLYFPRLEIGIWRYVDISGTNIHQQGFMAGFGGDVYGEEGSYWIWMDEDEVEFRSYGDASHIPRLEGWSVPADAAKSAKLLVTRAYLTEHWGITDVFLPWASDEDVNATNVIKEPFSSPSRALME